MYRHFFLTLILQSDYNSYSYDKTLLHSYFVKTIFTQLFFIIKEEINPTMLLYPAIVMAAALIKVGVASMYRRLK